MWKCPVCETLCTAKYCGVCGTAKPEEKKVPPSPPHAESPRSESPRSVPPSPKPTRTNYTLPIVLGIVVVCCALIVTHFIKNMPWSGPAQTAPPDDKVVVMDDDDKPEKAGGDRHAISNEDEKNANVSNAIPMETGFSEEVPVPGYVYHVHVGAFAVKSDAKAYADTLNREGIETYVKEINGSYSVQLGAYTDRQEAEEKYRYFQEMGLTVHLTYIAE